MLVDSHCHLDFPGLAEDLPGVIARARAAGVARMVTISTRVAHYDTYRAIAEAHPEVYFTVGTHPHQAAEEPDVAPETLVDLSRHPRCIGIGEAGLDYHYDTAPRDVQARVLRAHIAAARATQLPLVIHARDADEDMAAILTEETGQGAFPAVLHCFSSGPALARTGIALGFYLSFSGILTFRRSEDLRAIAAQVPPDRLLVETDAPYLAPQPHRGKPNEPAYVTHTAAVLAETLGMDTGALARLTTANFERLFAKAGPLVVTPDREARGGPMDRLTLRILGCGSSGGVPRVGTSGWGACDPADPRNRRRRCSVLIERTSPAGTTGVLVDTSPDLREQLLDAAVDRLDAILFTHAHADHTHGIDDVRPLVIAMRRRIPTYADEATAALLKARFGYCFETPPGSGYPPILDLHALHPATDFDLPGPGGPLPVLGFSMEHGTEPALGFRFGPIAYAPDVSRMPPDAVERLRGLDILVIDALRDTPHPTHYSVSDALALIEAVRPRRAVLTNLHTDLDYEALRQRLPPGVEPAHDGMVLEAGLADETERNGDCRSGHRIHDPA